MFFAVLHESGEGSELSKPNTYAWASTMSSSLIVHHACRPRLDRRGYRIAVDAPTPEARGVAPLTIESLKVGTAARIECVERLGLTSGAEPDVEPGSRRSFLWWAASNAIIRATSGAGQHASSPRLVRTPARGQVRTVGPGELVRRPRRR